MIFVNKMELLKQLADKLNNSQWYSETEEGFEAAMSMLENAPTVEAIPIEWIREWYTKHSPLIGSYVAYMLLDWQAENERNV